MASPKGRLYKTPFGDFPSVTTILSVKGNSFLDEWIERVGEEEAKRVSNEATNRGSIVHQLFEDYLNGKPVNLNNPVLKHHFMQCVHELNKFESIYGNEIPLYSKTLKVAGRCDCIAMINGKLTVVDFKTSKHTKNEGDIDSYREQCSAYAFMLNEMYNVKIDNYRIIITNLYESECTVFDGNPKDHIKQFYELRKQWSNLNGF